MATISVLNTSANLSGKTLLAAENDYTITGNLTFDRDPSAPFTVTASSAKVSNLDADKLDGFDWTSGVTNVQAGDGSLSAPAFGFQADTNNGMYRVGADNIALVTGGVAALDIDSVQQINSATQFRCKVAKTAAQTISNATATAITFGAGTETFDVGAMHDTGSNTSRITIPTGGDGIYLLHGELAIAASAVGQRQVYIRQNGTTTITALILAAAAATTLNMLASAIVNAVATDYFELVIYQDSGGNLDTSVHILSAVKLW